MDPNNQPTNPGLPQNEPNTVFSPQQLPATPTQNPQTPIMPQQPSAPSQPFAVPTPMVPLTQMTPNPDVVPVAPVSAPQNIAPQPIFPQQPVQNQFAQPSTPPVGFPQSQQILPPQPNPYMAGAPQKKLPVKLIIAAIAVVIVVAIIGFILLVVNSMPAKYSASSLASYSTGNYTASYPKPWSDQSSNKKLLDNIFGTETSSGISDVKIYAYKLNKASDSAQSILMTGDMNSMVSDKVLKEALTSKEAQNAFESQMSKSAESLSSSSHCESATNKVNSVKYNTARYIAEVDMALDCKLNAADKVSRGTDSIHLQIQMGAKNSKFYLMVMATDLKDWERNKAFYINNLVPSLKPKS